MYLVASYKSQFKCREITTGKYPVLDEPVSVHPTKPIVFFLAKIESALRAELCAAAFGPDDDPIRIWRISIKGWSVLDWKLSQDRELCMIVRACAKNGVVGEIVRLRLEDDEGYNTAEAVGRVKEVVRVEKDYRIPEPTFFECPAPDGRLKSVYY